MIIKYTNIRKNSLCWCTLFLFSISIFFINFILNNISPFPIFYYTSNFICKSVFLNLITLFHNLYSLQKFLIKTLPLFSSRVLNNYILIYIINSNIIPLTINPQIPPIKNFTIVFVKFLSQLAFFLSCFFCQELLANVIIAIMIKIIEQTSMILQIVYIFFLLTFVRRLCTSEIFIFKDTKIL